MCNPLIMINLKKTFSFLALAFLITNFSFGQIATGARTSAELLHIPNLYTLIDSAMVHSPLLKTKDIEIAIKELEWRAQRWEWTDYIQPFSEYRFGTVDNYVFSQTGVPIDIQQTQANRFNIGARINLTVFNAINWRYKIKQYDMAIELDEARRKEIEQAIAQEVIRLRNTLVTFRDILFLKSNHMVTQKANLQDAQLQYEAGEVPIMELARITEIATTAEEEYILANKELREALFLLIELVGRDDFTAWNKF